MMGGAVLVVGGDIRGVQTALDLADCGFKVTLVEKSPSLRRPDNTGESLRFMPKLLRAYRHPNINVLTGTSVREVKGSNPDFRVSLVQQPRYVNTGICTSCARCDRECPVNILSPSGTDGHKAVHFPGYGLKSVPSTRIIEKKGVAPCTAACPAGINVQGYVALVARGKFAEAFDLIADAVAFPRVLGRVCTHPCEAACTRGKVDHPVAICALKRFASNGNFSLNHGKVVPLSGTSEIAIIGAGPAGLTAAYDLARMGRRSTVFEALPVPGGMITVGMPRFRLPREVRQADIADIVRFGIEIRTSTPIGPDLTLDDLRRQGYRAILIAVGAHRNQKLGIAGEGMAGVINSIALLQALNLKRLVAIGRKVIVVGGGYTGIDSARTAIRLHCDRVLVVDRCAREDLVANPEEVAEAEDEGIEFEYLVTPVRIIGEDGKVAGVEFRRMKLGECDRSGRRHTTPIEGSEFLIEADTVIVATGQRPDLSFLGNDTTLTEGKRHIVVDPVTQATRLPGIFAAGDAAAPSGPMVNAISMGRRAAISIDRYLHDETLENGRTLTEIAPVEVNLAEVHIPPIERQPMPCLKHEDRIGNFEEVDLGFSTETAVLEAQRCLNCAVCSDCGECEKTCEVKAIDRSAAPKNIEVEVSTIVAGDTLSNPKWLALTADASGIYHLDSDSSLSCASAVAGRVMAELRGEHGIVPETDKEATSAADVKDVSRCEPRVGVFICSCGGEIGRTVDIPDVLRYCQEKDGVELARRVEYACTADTGGQIKAIAEQNSLSHVVVAACACCNLDQICFSCSDRRLQCKSNLLSQPDGVCYEFVNIREHCAWVHRQPDEATVKARGIIAAGIARARLSQPLSRKSLSVERSVLVVGAGVGGLRAAVDLARQGFPAIMVRDGVPDSGSAGRELGKELASSGVIVLEETHVADIQGTPGKYQVSVARDGKNRRLTVGAIVLDTSGVTKELPCILLKASESTGQNAEPGMSRLPGIFLCGTGQAMNAGEALVQGAAAASRAAVMLSRGRIEVAQTAAVVDTHRCRACGTCESVCPFGAVAVSDSISAQVNEGLCQGCGICIAHCPSGALSQSGYGDPQISASLEAVLS